VVIKVEYKISKVVLYGHQINFENDYYLQSDGPYSVLDLVVTFDSKLKFYDNINEKVNKSYAVLFFMETLNICRLVAYFYHIVLFIYLKLQDT